ncbi:hypothetical protein PCANB_000027 [Pneumocystis canis]|nr:hypothetical protein PCANB_000027 [Pneumocystis canis]
MDNGKIRTQGTSDDILSLTLTNKNDNFSLSISKKVSSIFEKNCKTDKSNTEIHNLFKPTKQESFMKKNI